ncbi:MAG: response regulator [Desulfobacteraceae bacterium]|jgi:two-component system response regulator BaeR
MTEEHILVIDDEKKLADILKDYLCKEGFKVTCLSRGDEALDKIKRTTPALILLDLMLPGMDGITLFREIRQLSDIPVIMITARVEEVDRLLGLELGADDYICKPFSPREVVARVKAVLRRVRTDETFQHRLVAGPIILDEATRKVTVQGTPVTLTPSEFGLLSVLIAFPERVFSRSELLDKVQGYQFEGYDRTIDSHVKNLRRKIADILPNQQIIQTIYGVGYRLNV